MGLSRRARRLAVHGLAGAFALLARSPSAAAQAGPWVTNGPPGGNVYCFAFDPSSPTTVYIGTERGVFRSDRDFPVWQPANAGLPAARVQTIAVDPSAPSTLYAGTLTPDGVPSVGIFKSTDRGATWEEVNNGLIDPITGIEPVDVESLAVDPSHPGTVLAGTRFSEIFKSIDGGVTWDPQTFGGFTAALEVSSIVFDPSSPSTVYAASNLGFLRSTDGGDSWAFFGNDTDPLFTLAIDPTTPSTIYAGTQSGSGVLKSTDGGAHFNGASSGMPGGTGTLPVVLDLAVDPSISATVYAATDGNGLFVSSDGATSWTPIGGAIPTPRVSAIAPMQGTPAILYAGTLGAGVFRSLDAGGSWVSENDGLDIARVFGVIADFESADEFRLFAATSEGVWMSDDGGGTWDASSAGLPAGFSVVAIAEARAGGETLFAGTLGGGLFSSMDEGGTWTATTSGLPDAYVSALAVDPSNQATVYAGTDHPDSSSQRVYKSVDGGATWTRTSLDAGGNPITDLAVDSSSSSRVAAVSTGLATYYLSTDAGGHWTRVTPDASCGVISTIAFGPSSAVYLGGTGGVCRSADGGQTWSASPIGTVATVDAILIDPADSSVLYAGAARLFPGSQSGVYRSSDGGATWEALGTGLESAIVRALVLDPSGTTLFAGIDSGSVASLSLTTPARLPITAIPPPAATRSIPPR